MKTVFVWAGVAFTILVIDAVVIYLVGIYLIGQRVSTFWDYVRKAPRIDQSTYEGQMELARRIQAEEDARGD